MMRAHLLVFASLHQSAADPAVGYNLPFGGSNTSGFAASPGSDGVGTTGNQLGLHGPNGAYLVQDAGISDWWDAKYLKLNLLGKEFTYSTDLSKIGCGCVASVNFLAMGNPGPNVNYCDMQTGHGWSPCFQLDIMEASSKGFQSSLHTHPGTMYDKSCNQLGCAANIGRYPLTRCGLHTRDLYGPGASVIDTARPFKVTARMDSEGHLEVSLSQGNSVLPLYNHSSAGNSFPASWKPSRSTPASEYPAASGVPDYSVAKTADAMQAGLVMAVSLWSAEDTQWLDSSACDGAPRCDMDTATFIMSDLQIRELPATTTAPASTTPPPTGNSTGAQAKEDSTHSSTLFPGQILWPDALAPVPPVPSIPALPITAGGMVAGADVAPSVPPVPTIPALPITAGGAVEQRYVAPPAPPVPSIPALPIMEQFKQVPRFRQKFESSTGSEASARVQAAAVASISSVFSPNLLLVGLLAFLSTLGCMIAVQRRSYLQCWLQAQHLDADTCLIESE